MKLVSTLLWVTAVIVSVLIVGSTALTITGHASEATRELNAAGGVGFLGAFLAFLAWLVA